ETHVVRCRARRFCDVCGPCAGCDGRLQNHLRTVRPFQGCGPATYRDLAQWLLQREAQQHGHRCYATEIECREGLEILRGQFQGNRGGGRREVVSVGQIACEPIPSSA